jgi:hypothetical protein
MLGNELVVMLGCKLGELDGNPVGERSVSSTTPGLVVGEKDSLGASVVPGLIFVSVGEFVSDIGAMKGLLVIAGAVSEGTSVSVGEYVSDIGAMKGLLVIAGVVSEGPIGSPGFPITYSKKIA